MMQEYEAGGLKTPKHLKEELESGEAAFSVENGRLVRNIRVATVDIFYAQNGELYHLVEDRQVYKNGFERKRPKRSSLSEKIKKGEEPGQAAKRGVLEELGFAPENPLLEKYYIVETRESRSYHNLTTSYKCFGYELSLNKGEYREEGYIEEQEEKTTYFTWEKIN